MSLNAAVGEDARLIMVGGKGGVGKTTCASAIAFGLASRGRKVLCISSDPTPSLSDIYETEIGGREKKILDEIDLYGLEISSEMVLAKWKERFGREIYEVISSFADVDYDFVDYVGTAPGIEEEYMLYYILELTRSGAYDVVVWDTAPAGHTLRLLRLPHLFLTHLEGATKFYMNMYSLVERFKDTVRLKSSKKTLLQLIGGWEELSRGIIDFIRQKSTTRYVLVTIPEALGVRLTERMMKELDGSGLEVGDLIINHIVREEDCEFHRIRRAMQDRYIRRLEETFSAVNTLKLYLAPYEIKGIERIREIACALLPA
ncbi:MAG: ArsA family ATPase [Syntrophorhabdales bacterium]|jgi:arsenite-transporting ATPase